MSLCILCKLYSFILFCGKALFERLLSVHDFMLAGYDYPRGMEASLAASEQITSFCLLQN